MKLFGSNQRNDDFDKTTQFPVVKQSQSARSQPNYGYGGGAGGGMPPSGKKKKKKKLPLTRKQKFRRVVTISALLLAFVLGVAAFAWKTVWGGSDSIAENTWKNTTADTTENGQRIADYFTFVVGAVDKDETRTDNLMVVGFDTKNKKINILSIPRDTRTASDRVGASNKINAAYGTKDGMETLKSDIKDLLGFTPDYHMIVNLQGIADIVDAIGGVDYDIPFRMYYKDPSQDLSIDFQPGMTHLNGEETVEFLRWRKNNGGVSTGDKNYTGGDEQRIQKEQEFLRYLASQVLSASNVTKIPKIAQAVFANVKTDFTSGELLWMAEQAVGLDKNNLQMFTLPGEAGYATAGTSDHLSFFFPDETETLALVNQYFNPYQEALTDLNIVSKSSSKSSSSSTTTTKHKKKTTSSSTTTTKKSSDTSSSTKDSSTDTSSDSTSEPSGTDSSTSDSSGAGSDSTSSSGSDSGSSSSDTKTDDSTTTSTDTSGTADSGNAASSASDPEA